MEFKDEAMFIAPGMRSSATGMWSRFSLQELDIRYIVTYNFTTNHAKVAERLINHFII